MSDFPAQFLLLEQWYPNICLWLLIALKSSAVVVTGWCFASFLQSRSGSARCWIWRATLLAVLAIPAFEFGPNLLERLRPAVEVKVTSESIRRLYQTAAELKIIRSEKELGELQIQRRRQVTVQEAPPWEDTPPWSLTNRDFPRAPWSTIEKHLFELWWIVSGALITILGLRVGIGAAWLRGKSGAANDDFQKRAEDAARELGLRARPIVRVIESLRSPLIVGVWRPSIYLPSQSTGWSEEKLRSVFFHELSHFLRNDNVWQYLAKFCGALFWWNPLVASVGRQMAAAAEEAADDTVLLHRQSAEGYAAALVEIAAEQPLGHTPLVGLSMVGRHSLEKRIRALLRPNPWRGKIGPLPFVLTLLLLGTSILGASFYFSNQVEIPPSSANSRPQLDADQRKTLERALNANIARFNALRFLHFVAEIKESEKGTNYQIKAPVPTRMEAWVDEWTGIHRAEFRPFVSRWIQGKAPFFVSDVDEINDGKNLYRFDVDDSRNDIRARDPEPLDLYLGTREICDFIRSARGALESPTARNAPRYTLETDSLHGKSMLRLQEQFFYDGKLTQQRTFFVDPSQDDMVAFAEISFPSSIESGPSQWILQESGVTASGVRYPLKYQTVLSRSGLQTISDARVISLEPLTGLPPNITVLPEDPTEKFAAKTSSPIRHPNLVVSYRDAVTGKPIPNVTVTSKVNRAEATKSISDKNGEVSISLPNDEILYLNASSSAPGYVPQVVGWEKRGDPLQLPGKYEVNLLAAVPISGRVLNGEGQPIANAEVEIWLTGPGPRVWSVFHDRLQIFGNTIKTNAAGEWTFLDAPKDLTGLGIRVSASGYQATSDDGFSDFRMATGLNYSSLRDGTADIKLSQGATLSGRVQDNEGRPVPDCLITIGRDSWGANLPTTKTDAAGNFVLKGLEAEKTWLSAESPIHQPYAEEITLPASHPLVITLAPGKILRGRILKEDGTPSAGLNVRSDTWHKLRTLTFATQTDQDGRFVWKGAPEDAVTFSFGGCQSREFLADLPLTATAGEQTISMRPALRLKARVVGQDPGKPIDKIKVTPGYYFSPKEISWHKDEAQSYRNGEFEWKSDRVFVDEVFQIEAEGYEPFQSPPFSTNQKSFDVAFALTPKK